MPELCLPMLFCDANLILEMAHQKTNALRQICSVIASVTLYGEPGQHSCGGTREVVSGRLRMLGLMNRSVDNLSQRSNNLMTRLRHKLGQASFTVVIGRSIGSYVARSLVSDFQQIRGAEEQDAQVQAPVPPSANAPTFLSVLCAD